MEELIAKLEQPGLDVNKLQPGTLLKVTTVNTLYEFKVTEKPGYLEAFGGIHIPKSQVVRFNGSTYGGSAIRLGWIGRDLHMEISLNNKVLTTSPVQKVNVSGDDWAYDLWD